MHADYDALKTTLAAAGPAAAAEDLCRLLAAREDYHALFYARLLQARVRLGVTPFPTGASSDLPAAVHEEYESAIRTAAREVGALWLAKGDIARAWGFFRLIQEPQPVKDALDAAHPGPDDDADPLIDIAWHQRVHRSRGFDIMLARRGICSCITLLGQTDLRDDPTLRNECVAKLATALHAQLHERLLDDWANRNWTVPHQPTLRSLLKNELFEQEVFHIDTSHLASVVQMALELPPGPALTMARELCDYGTRLAPAFQTLGDPPFENGYRDYAVLLAIIDGDHIEAGLKYFEDKIEREGAEGNTFPAEVFVNLLIRLDRKADALAAAKRYFTNLPQGLELTCPTVAELARQVGDHATLAAVAEADGDRVNYLAALIAARSS